MEIKSKPRYFIGDEMVWAFAKDAMKADLERQEKVLERLYNRIKNTDPILGDLEIRAFEFYRDHLQHEYELRQQTYEKFLQMYKELEDARNE